VPDLKKTPLYDAHVAAGARIIDFGGWAMPVQYKLGIIKEHKQVRAAVGLFDVSHMGEVYLRGETALATVQRLITNDATRLADGQALYTVLCKPDGGIVDDCIVYRRGAGEFLIILNANCREKDVAWIREQAGDTDVTDASDDTALIAVQGPAAVELTSALADVDLAAVPRFGFVDGEVAGVPCMAARTGYTGEDGFELLCPADRARILWDNLVARASEAGGGPIGLGARDTLRLEARLCLYGNDIDETTNPYEAGLGWVVKLDAGDFIGREALAEVKAAGPSRKLVGFRIDGRGIARPHHPIVDRSLDEPIIGEVTSGTSGITVGGAIGMGYVPAAYAGAGKTVTIDVRGKDVDATQVKGPFYKRSDS
jgi:aminomethyltransferase